MFFKFNFLAKVSNSSALISKQRLKTNQISFQILLGYWISKNSRNITKRWFRTSSACTRPFFNNNHAKDSQMISRLWHGPFKKLALVVACFQWTICLFNNRINIECLPLFYAVAFAQAERVRRGYELQIHIFSKTLVDIDFREKCNLLEKRGFSLDYDVFLIRATQWLTIGKSSNPSL